MAKLTALIIGTLFSLSTLGQGLNDFKVRVSHGKIDEHIFFLETNEGIIELDSMELKALNPNWIKAINVVQLVEESEQDHTTTNLPTTTSVYIELKRRSLKKYLKKRLKKNDI
ncbi:MAG: hypothetical protein RJQ09_01810 [Cyclobacteriaceae bacterium]